MDMDLGPGLDLVGLTAEGILRPPQVVVPPLDRRSDLDAEYLRRSL